MKADLEGFSEEIVQLILAAAEAKKAQDIIKAESLMDEAIDISESSGNKDFHLRLIKETLLVEYKEDMKDIDWSNLESTFNSALLAYTQDNNVLMQIDTLINLASWSCIVQDFQKANKYLMKAETIIKDSTADSIETMRPSIGMMSGATFLLERKGRVRELRAKINTG